MCVTSDLVIPCLNHTLKVSVVLDHEIDAYISVYTRSDSTYML